MAEYVTTEMHTGGDPVRIVEKGYPEIKGATILEKIRYLKKELDHVRKLLMWEPRGQNHRPVASH
jgi:trans-L-3-hydroxyproline dehydratase